MGGVLLSKSLIQFSVDGWDCVASLLFGLRPNCQPRLHWRLFDTHRQVLLSLVGTLLFSPGSWCTQGFVCVCVCVCALWESVSPVLWKFCNQTPLASKVKFTGGSQSFCWIPRLANLLWVLELYLKVWEFLWYNCSAVCGSSVQQFYAGAKGDLLQEGLCHRLHDPGLLQGVTKLICIYHIWFIHLSAYEHEHIN